MLVVTIGAKYVNMADINSSATRAAIAEGVAATKASAPVAITRGNTRPETPAKAADLVAPDLVAPDLVAMVELLFFAYRDFTAEPDAILSQLGFGRAHHRVLHFVNRHPGLRVADLLDVLRITKQSLARVLKQLVDEGFVQQAAGENDRRERRLHVTAKGQALAERLLELQTRRMAVALGEASALSAAGEAAGPVARRFLLAVIAGEDRADVKRLVEGRQIGGIQAGGRRGDARGQRGAPPHTQGES